MSEPTDLRIGNAERESAVAALDEHLREGRLDADEYGERYARITTARTQRELTALFTDLPQPHPKLPGYRAPRNRAPRESRVGGLLHRLQAMPTWLLILGAIALVSAVRAPWLFGGVFFWIFVFPWLFGGRRGYCGGKRRHHAHSESGYTYPSGSGKPA